MERKIEKRKINIWKSLKKKSNERELTLSDIKIQYNVVMIKAVQCWCMNRQINGAGHSEINLNMYGN